MTQQFSRFLWMVCVLLLPLTLSGQEAGNSKDRVKVTLRKYGWSEAGELVLGLKVQAKANEELALFTAPSAPPPGSDFRPEEMPNNPFSLFGSKLVDGYTGIKLAALEELPEKPNYGFMTITVTLQKGGWVKMSVAFPKPPLPPPDKFGKPQPYKFMLHLPLEVEPLEIKIPANP